MHDLTVGFLSDITRQAIADPDLDLEIRNSYLNLYYKGNSLLKLSENRLHDYRVEIHAKFAADLNLPARLIDQASPGWICLNYNSCPLPNRSEFSTAVSPCGGITFDHWMHMTYEARYLPDG